MVLIVAFDTGVGCRSEASEHVRMRAPAKGRGDRSNDNEPGSGLKVPERSAATGRAANRRARPVLMQFRGAVACSSRSGPPSQS